MNIQSIARHFLSNTIKRSFSSSASIVKVITQDDIKMYAKLTGDHNPVHFQGNESIVHGTYLIGLVSCVMGTKCPGAGTKVLELSSKFFKPCVVGTEVKIEVNLSERRKITNANYVVCQNSNPSHIFVEGKAKLLLT